MKKIEIEIKGMTCNMCVGHVEKRLRNVEGVKQVQIPSWKTGKAIVDLAGSADLPTIENAFAGADYTVKAIRDISPEEKVSTTSQADNFMIDLVVIGTGGAGMAAAIEAAKMGKKTIIIEKGTLGGTCVNVGCIPSKAFIKAANLKYNSENVSIPGLKANKMDVDWGELLSARQNLVESLRAEKYEDVLKSYPEISLITKSSASFFQDSGSGHPLVELEDGTIIKACKYIIATGSRPKLPEVPGISDIKVLDSTAALFLDKQPGSLIVVGGGFVALELAQGFSRLGTKIEGMVVRSSVLSKWDKDISDEITGLLAKEGINIYPHSKMVKFFNKGKQKGLEIKNEHGTRRELLADNILIATGRQANVDHLNLDSVNVKLSSDNSIAVNEYLQTSNPAIYAAGDCASLPKLVYVAAKSGKLAARHALYDEGRQTVGLNISVLPEVIFTDPQIAQVGLSETAVKSTGNQIMICKLSLENVPKAIVAHKTEGFIKLVVDKNNNTLIGAHIVSENAGELIQTAAMAISMGMRSGFSIDDFMDLLFPYLTETEGLKLSAQTLSMDVSQLSCCAG